MILEKIQLPQPTGHYTVGMKNYFLKDPSRCYKDVKGRPLLIQIYYPSVKEDKEYPFYLFDTMHLYKEKIINTYNVSLSDLEYLDKIKDWAMLDASFALENAPFSVLFFSPGFLMAAQLYSSLIEEMASRGYVVIAMNHTDACWPVMFPDGTVPEIVPEFAHIFDNKEQSCIQAFDNLQETWVKDIEFVLLWLQNGPLQKRLDFSRLGIFGHSFGGSVAIEMARKNISFKAVASLDSFLFGFNWNRPFEVPSLFVMAEKPLTSKKALSSGLSIEQLDSLLARSSKKVFDQLDTSFYVTVKDTDHASFVDSRIIKSPLAKRKKNLFRGIEVTRLLLVDFFDYHLKNKKMDFLCKQNALPYDILVT